MGKDRDAVASTLERAADAAEGARAGSSEPPVSLVTPRRPAAATTGPSTGRS
jgi:hypothetical protein